MQANQLREIMDNDEIAFDLLKVMMKNKIKSIFILFIFSDY
jgi:hypothetical protein